MATLFIADLHLCVEEPAITAGFLRFSGEARRPMRCIFLAICLKPDRRRRSQSFITRWPQRSKRYPIPAFPVISFMATVIFCSANALPVKAATLLPEEKVLELYGRRVLIMHGDTLCTDDAGYQAFRAKVHKPRLQTLFLALPLFVRNALPRECARTAKKPTAVNRWRSWTLTKTRWSVRWKTSSAMADPRAYPSPGGA